MNYFDTLKILNENSIDNASHEATIIVLNYTKKSTSWLLINKEYQFNETEENLIRSALNRRIAHEPLQYILGEWYFYGDKYYVSPDCLIPREDTELIVDNVIQLLPPNGILMDLCTGSGCIAISTLKKRTDCTAVAIDLSSKAIEIARRNAILNMVEDRLELICSDIFRDLCLTQKFDIITSNPPYIATNEIKNLNIEVKQEPIIALDGGADGLVFYKELVSNYMSYIKPGGYMILEIGYNQAEDVKKLFESGKYKCNIIKDYGHNDRCVIIKN